ncbi:MAG TPA: Fe-S cluster assembly ATPase SufC [Gemmatimonadetes bacterium]|nr:Fe-S cluster assembly ATPase SufC [Gemmatimonadota bacterium]|tara:strand:- start:293 stop:1108 length:816 start_codon:yes stop_codon:yes gene_type:complete
MSDTSILTITGLRAKVIDDDLDILMGVDLELRPGQIHTIMGPNGSGKSTLAKVLAGHPDYEVTGGDVVFNGQSILDLEPNERALAGMFLAFQYPTEIPGVSIANFLRTALQARLEDGEEVDLFDFQEELLDRMKLLDMDPAFAERPVNDGFSGGEKKRNEILQMAVLRPTLALMDETDSGLDIDALQIVANGVNTLREENPDMTVLLITHYQRMLNYIKPDAVHVMVGGRIVRSGGPEVAIALEEQGYADWKEQDKDEGQEEEQQQEVVTA